MVNLSRQVSNWVAARNPFTGFGRIVVSTVLSQSFALLPFALFTILQSRLLGAAGKGEVTLVVSVAALATAVADFGYTAVMPYRAGLDKRRPELLLWNFGLWTALTVPLVFFGIFVLASLDQPAGLAQIVEAYPGYLVLLVISGLINFFVQSEALSMRDFRAYNALTAISHLIMAAAFLLTYLVAPERLSVETAMVCYSLGYLGGSSAIMFMTYQRMITYFRRFSISLKALGEHIRESIKPFVSGLIEILLARIDIFLLIAFGGDLAVVGYYSVALLLVQVLEQVPRWIGLTVVPKAAHNDSDAVSLTIKLASVSMLVALGSVGFYIALEPILPQLIASTFGAGFSIVYFILLFMLPRTIFKSVGDIFSGNLAGRGYTRYYPIAGVVALAVNLGLNLILIPSFGVYGAAATQSITQLFQVSILIYGFCQVNQLSVFGLPAEFMRSWLQLLRMVHGRLIASPRRS